MTFSSLQYLFERLSCFPDCGCEPMIAGCLICQPVNVASSIFYFLPAIYLFLRFKNKNPEFLGWMASVVLVGITSILAHSSYTRIFMAMDYSSIIFIFSFFVLYDITKKLSFWTTFGLCLVYYFSLMFMLLNLDIWTQYYISLVVFSVALVFFLKKHGLSVFKAPNVLASIATFTVSMLFLLYDKHESICSIPYLPYGHTLWHMGSALGMYFFGKWYFFDRSQVAEIQ